jgi:hypothetical protein
MILRFVWILYHLRGFFEILGISKCFEIFWIFLDFLKFLRFFKCFEIFMRFFAFLHRHILTYAHTQILTQAHTHILTLTHSHTHTPTLIHIRLIRIERGIVSISYNKCRGNSCKWNSKVKRARPGALWGWVTKWEVAISVWNFEDGWPSGKSPFRCELRRFQVW